MQVKALGKKAQQTTPRGSPTKPQPLQRGGPLEAVNVAVLAQYCCCNKYSYFIAFLSVAVHYLLAYMVEGSHRNIMH